MGPEGGGSDQVGFRLGQLGTNKQPSSVPLKLLNSEWKKKTMKRVGSLKDICGARRNLAMTGRVQRKKGPECLKKKECGSLLWG